EDCSAAHRIQAKKNTQQFGPSRADNAGDAQDFAAVQGETDATGQEPASQVANFDQRLSDRMGHLRILCGEAPADHQLNDALSRKVLNVAATHAPPIPEHCKAVGDFLYLFQEMADVDDCDPTCA